MMYFYFMNKTKFFPNFVWHEKSQGYRLAKIFQEPAALLKKIFSGPGQNLGTQDLCNEFKQI